MEVFHYHNDQLFCEKTSLKQLAAEVGTPLYVYSRGALEENFKNFDNAFGDVPHLVCYAVKSNSNLSILRLFRDLGAGVDIVSGGELFRARQAEIDPQKIVFSGVGKKNAEIDDALNTNILIFNVESKAELDAIEARAKFLNNQARVSFRVNPDIDPKTHPNISTGLQEHKFGISTVEVIPLYQYAGMLSHVKVVGISCHIGSQVTSLDPFLQAAQKIFELLRRLEEAGIRLRYVNLGGGLGIRYHDESPPSIADYAQALRKCFAGKKQVLILEPGRILCGKAGLLLTEVLYVKKSDRRRFVIVDAGMNDLIRPGLYDAYHEIWPVERNASETFIADIVGPVCESTDFFAHDRKMPITQKGELLAIMDTGAYGFSLSSNYNSRPRPAEALVKNNAYQVIRKRESYEDLVRGEKGL
ncbi:MAG: diaminopimelate decarboxylase [Acidobacteria bacterium]|nr:MAG: diaminopimelate decarboxylase [Acidobacteriota bacterium]